MDRDQMRDLLIEMRVAYDDDAAVLEDMLRPLRERELGQALHQKHHVDARDKFIHAHDLAMSLIESESGPVAH